MTERAWWLLPVSFFGLVYACSLSFVYVEGDDARSIAFHAMGRDPTVQPPYADYQSMMDVALRVLPADESVLRVSAILLSSVAAGASVLLLLELVFGWLGDLSRERKSFIALAALLASPELFYLGLVYLPSVVSFSLVLTAHLLLRRGCDESGFLDLLSRRGKLTFAASVAAFGLGGACRWDMTVYGAVIVTDLLLVPGRREARHSVRTALRRQLAPILAWSAGALVAFMAGIWASGYSPRALAKLVGWGYAVVSGHNLYSRSFDLKSVLYLQSFASPAFLLLAAVGWAALAARRHPLAILTIVSVALVAGWIPLGIPKYLLPAAPAAVAGMAVGLLALWDLRAHRKALSLALRVAVVALFLGPWIVGVRVDDPDISWGPGFETRRPDGDGAGPGFGGLVYRAEGRRAWPVVGAGLALPTSEGPRPLGGHAAVLLGGGWRRLTRELDRDRRDAFLLAWEMGLPLLQQHGEGFVSELAGMGFATSDPSPRLTKEEIEGPSVRLFKGPNGGELMLLRCLRQSSLTRGGEELRRLHEIAGDKVVVYAMGETLRDVYRKSPGAVHLLSSTSAILDLGRLRLAVAEIPTVPRDR